MLNLFKAKSSGKSETSTRITQIESVKNTTNFIVQITEENSATEILLLPSKDPKTEERVYK